MKPRAQGAEMTGRRSLTTFLLLPLVLAVWRPSPARAQGFDYDAYEPRTLAELVAKYDSKELTDPKARDGDRIFGALFPSRVRVTYTGESRKLSDGRKQFVGDWIKTRQLDPRIGDLFVDDWKFVEGGAEHWLPVQKQVAAFFEKELKKGDAVDVYVVITGG